MSGVNKAIIVGRLGADPELRFTGAGRAVCNFNLATSSVWKDKTSGERKEDTQWHKIVVWGAQAESCSKYLAKGRETYVEGEIRTRNYEDKEGIKRYITEIIARDVRFLGSKADNEGRQQSKPADPDAGFDETPDDDDDSIPF